MSTNLRPVPSRAHKPRRTPLVGYALIAAVAVTLITVGLLRTISQMTDEGITVHAVVRGVFFVILTGGACWVAEICMSRLRPVSRIVKERRVLKRERKQFQRDYKKTMETINKIISQQEAWLNTKTILEGVYDRVYRTRVVHYFKKTKTTPFCGCTTACANTCNCPICHEGARA